MTKVKNSQPDPRRTIFYFTPKFKWMVLVIRDNFSKLVVGTSTDGYNALVAANKMMEGNSDRIVGFGSSNWEQTQQFFHRMMSSALKDPDFLEYIEEIVPKKTK